MPMNVKHDDDLDQLTQQFDVLRSTILHGAKAMVLNEDRRAQVLAKRSMHASPDAVPALLEQAKDAWANADAAMAVVVQVERLTSDPAGPWAMVVAD